ncbi:hypothetical protein [Aurantiacibacter sediminis]|uniref:Uncharacterized protein n=1 Tax=Aurantiacibacter sediminis TaxID=2793064 RepID=A0ABS0MZ58_9SPHN|nr:hypothetical protein [Aurantiacibacter sediminis]MBH5321005.1 hypothetical protein [Aurantiacibacter sediminis]
MALSKPSRRKAPLGVPIMLLALVLSAVFGAAAGLVWQSSDWAEDEPEEEVLVREGSAG